MLTVDDAFWIVTKKFKGLVIAVLLLFFSVFPAYSAMSIHELRQRASQKPQNTLLLLDSLQKKAAYPAYQLDYLRACAYFRLSMFEKSLSLAKKAYNSVEIKSDTLLYRQIYMILAESAVFSYSLNDATQYILKGKKYALSIKRKNT